MSETAKRIISGVVLGGLVVAILYSYEQAAGLHAFALILAFALLGVSEFYRLTDRGMDGKPVRAIGIGFTVILLAVVYADYLSGLRFASEMPAFLRSVLGFVHGIHNPILPLFLVFMIVTASYSMVFRPLDGMAFTISTTILGPLYAAMPLGFVFSLVALPEGMFFLLYIALVTIMTDVGAYFAGRWFGKHNAGLKVSPKKTYEGYVGGLITANITAQAFLFGWLHFFPASAAHLPGLLESIFLALVISVVSVLGDLVESALKRDARIKDSSATIPGHGGVLDLLDALLFTFPAGYYYFYLRFLVLA